LPMTMFCPLPPQSFTFTKRCSTRIHVGLVGHARRVACASILVVCNTPFKRRRNRHETHNTRHRVWKNAPAAPAEYV
jgi:hypothetical protein